jgi:hypothetical protein
MADITQEQFNAAEADYLATKENGDAEDKKQAAQAFADLRRAFKLQQTEVGQRDVNTMVVVDDEASQQ